MGKKLRLTVVAFLLSFVMLMLAVPQVLWVEAAEAIKEMDIVTIREKVDNLPDIDARIDFESLTIIEEDDARRTLNSKEYILSNGMRMVKQFSKNVHYYENGVYKEITNNTAELEKSFSTSEQTGFKQINVFENGTITEDKQLVIGKKEGTQKSDAYLQFEMAKKGIGYNLLYSKLEFSHQTHGMSLLSPKNIKYSVSLVENIDFSNITYENKPKQIGQTKTYGANVNVGSTTDNYIYQIDVNAVQDNTVTFAMQTDQVNSDGGYSVINADQIVLTSVYNRTYGIDERYGVEEIDVNNIQAYVDYDVNHLTLNYELFTVNSTGKTPLKISLINNQGYNDIFDELSATSLGNVKMFGNNTKLNFQQYTREEDITVFHYDSDGSITPYYQTNANYYHNEMGTATLIKENNKHKIVEANGNISIFMDGRLVELSNNLEKIEISYNGTSSKIQSIKYYERYENEQTQVDYQINFTYQSTTGYVQSISAKKRDAQLIEYTFTYNAYGNLSSVYNINAGVDAYTIEYDNTENMPVIFINDHKQEGMYFTYNSSEEISNVQTIVGDSSTHKNRNDSLHFYKLEDSLRQISYSLDSGSYDATKKIALNDSRRVMSEWIEKYDDDTQVNIPGIWENTDGEQYVFDLDTLAGDIRTDKTKKSYVQTIKQTTSLTGSRVLSAGQSITGKITEQPNYSGYNTYAYALIFRVQNANNKKILVNVNNQNSRTIILGNCSTTYVAVSCGYLMANNTDFFTITNDASNSGSIAVSDVTYGVVDYAQETQKFDTTSSTTYLSDAITHSLDGEKSVYAYNLSEEKVTQAVYNAQGLEQTTSVDKNESSLTTTVTRNSADVLVETDLYDENNIVQKTITQADLYTRQISYAYQNQENKRIITETESGFVKEYVYSISRGDERLTSYKENDRKEKYDYNYFGELLTRKLVQGEGTEEQILESQQHVYTDGQLTGINYGYNPSQTYNNGHSFYFNLTYDSVGRLSKIKHNGTTMIKYGYYSTGNGMTNQLTRKTFANGNVANYTYGSYGVSKIAYKNSSSDASATDEYAISRSNTKVNSISHKRNSNTLLTYAYSESGNENAFTISGLSNTLTYTNLEDAVSSATIKKKATITVGNDTSPTIEISQTYDKYGLIKNTSYSNYSTSFSYDRADRMTKQTVNYSGNLTVEKTFEYGNENYGANQYIYNKLVAINDSSGFANNAYAIYSDDGNVEEINYNGKNYNYYYDSLNRLSEERYNNNSVWVNYTYNETYKSIASKQVTNSGVASQTNYVYDSLGRLTQINEGNATYYFAYDAMGNPTRYKSNSASATANMSWTQGRYLSSGNLNGNTFNYDYDVNGIRYKKTVNNNVTEYYLNGTQIIAENRINNGGMIYYLYDATGIAGMIYNNTRYLFDKNTLGDIIRIRDASGAIVARYSYDAWGNIIEKTGAMADINPFRYRGYYYDNETGFYYLQSRYYDPYIMRFINADNYEILSTLMSDTNQLYMYNYCNNNPVMYTDPSGQSLSLGLMLIGALVGFFTGGVVAVAEQVDEHGWNVSEWDLLEIGVVATGGALSGMFAGMPIGMWGQVAINAGICMVQNIGTQAYNNGQINILEVIKSGFIGAVAGLAGGSGVTFFSNKFVNQISYYTIEVSFKVMRNMLVKGILKATTVGCSIDYLFDLAQRGN